jgi:hypothetical protein
LEGEGAYRDRTSGCYPIAGLLFLLLSAFSSTTFTHASSSPGEEPRFLSLRYEEDFSWLKEPDKRVGLWQGLKYIPLGRNYDRFITLGGEVRLRYEYYRNPGWGDDKDSRDRYLLQRYMFHSDLHLCPHVRFFLQLRSAVKTGGASLIPPTRIPWICIKPLSTA